MAQSRVEAPADDLGSQPDGDAAGEHRVAVADRIDVRRKDEAFRQTLRESIEQQQQALERLAT